jgi:quinol---cytochrome c reductase iron-sulfur subunit, bacillus type
MTEEYSSPAEVGRRRFLTGIIGVVAGTVAALVGLPAIGYVVSPGVKKQGSEEWITLGALSSLTLGVPSGFPYSRTIADGWVQSTQTGTAYALTTDGQTVTVFSDICTHLSCRVTLKPETLTFVCPCHDGVFSATGAVLAGPPPRPLDQFESRVEGDQIQIKLEA